MFGFADRLVGRPCVTGGFTSERVSVRKTNRQRSQERPNNIQDVASPIVPSIMSSNCPSIMSYKTSPLQTTYKTSPLQLRPCRQCRAWCQVKIAKTLVSEGMIVIIFDHARDARTAPVLVLLILILILLCLCLGVFEQVGEVAGGTTSSRPAANTGWRAELR